MATGSTAELQQKYPFYVWDKTTCEVRLVTSWDNTPEDIADFCQIIKNYYNKITLA